MSRITHLAAYMFRTLTVRNVRLTRKSKISRLTRLRLLHYPKTYGMSCASSVEIEDVWHKALCRLHVSELLRYGMCVLRESLGLPADLGSGFCIIEDLRYVLCVFHRNRGCLALSTLPLTCSELLRYVICVLRGSLRFPA